jgi:hypothetical protein
VFCTVPKGADLYIGDLTDPVDLELEDGDSMLAKSLAWINANGADNRQYTILLEDDETEATSVGYEIKGANDKKNRVITLQDLSTDPENPVTITKNTAGSLFTVYGSTSTNTDDVPELILENITLKGFEAIILRLL